MECSEDKNRKRKADELTNTSSKSKSRTPSTTRRIVPHTTKSDDDSELSETELTSQNNPAVRKQARRFFDAFQIDKHLDPPANNKNNIKQTAKRISHNGS